jgi:hypothetical protein
MNKKQIRRQSMETVEQGVWLLRRLPTRLLMWYAVGSVPFWIMLAFFLEDMRRSASAVERCAPGALLLTVLFLWMKVCQQHFGRGVMACLTGAEQRRLTIKGILRSAGMHAIVQPTSVPMLLTALIITLPFPHAYSFYHNLCFADPEDSFSAACRRAWKQACANPKQNAFITWLLGPYIFTVLLICVMGVVYWSGLQRWLSLLPIIILLIVQLLFIFFILFAPLATVVALNIAVLLIGVPMMMKSLLGIDTAISMSPFATLTTPGFWFLIVALTHLVLDPVLKCVYAIRNFHSDTRTSGEDLTVRWRNLLRRSATATMLIICLGAPMAVQAAPNSAPTAAHSDLNEAIDRTLEDPEFAWRLDRLEGADGEGAARSGLIGKLIDNIDDAAAALRRMVRDSVSSFGDKFEKFLDWLLNRNQPAAGSSWWSGFTVNWLHTLSFILITALAAILAIAIVRNLRGRWRKDDETPVAEVVDSVPDLADENVTAADLPEDEWLRLAAEMSGKGNLRLAMRALFLGTIAYLADRNLLVIARFKSNREYERELQRRGHALPEVGPRFAANRRMFDSIWYGTHPVTEEMLADFKENVEAMRQDV